MEKKLTREAIRFKQGLNALRFEISGDIVDELFISFQSMMDAETAALQSRIKELEEEKKKLEFMIENGLGPDDIKNDII